MKSDSAFIKDALALCGPSTDIITDMNVSGKDTIHLDDAFFAGLALGGLGAAAFKDLSLGAVDADHRIINDKLKRRHLF